MIVVVIITIIIDKIIIVFALHKSIGRFKS